MGVILQRSTANAPEIEDAIYDAIFNGTSAESHPDWAGPNKFGGQDDGERWRFTFTPLSEEGEVLYNAETGEPIEVDVLTNQTMDKRSNAYAIMSGILTKAERDAIDAGETIDTEGLIGRKVQIVVEHNDKGWPKVAQVIPARGGKAAAPAAAPKPAEVEAPAETEDDEEAALLAKLEAAKAKKAAAEAKPTKPTVEEKAAAEKAARIAAAKAALAELEES